MKKKLFALTTAVAVTLLLFSSLPALASAQTEEVQDLTLSGHFTAEEIEEKGHVALTERFKDKLNQVEYENDDGTRTAYVFSKPVKYVADDGEVQYIDTTLETAPFVDQLRGYAYKVDGNAFETYFPKKDTGKVQIKGDDFSFTQKIVDNDSPAETGKLQNAKSVSYANEDSANAKEYSYKSTSTGYSGTVQYNSLPADGMLSIELAGDNIAATLSEDGQLTLAKNNVPIGAVHNSGLKDAEGKLLADCTPSVTDNGTQINFTFDTTALGNVSYPLTLSYYVEVEETTDSVASQQSGIATYANVDTTTTDILYDEIQTTNAYEPAPTTNYATDPLLLLKGGTGTASRIYVKFDLSSFVEEDIIHEQIISAKYRMYQTSEYNYPYSIEHDQEGNEIKVYQPFEIEVHQVSTGYNINQLTWNNQPSHYSTVLIGDSIVPEDDTNEKCAWFHYMITNLVQGWIQGLPNCGIVFKMKDETDGIGVTRAFASPYYYDADYCPELAVTYTTDNETWANIGIESNVEYYIKNKGSVTEGTQATEALYLTAPSSTSGTVTKSPFTGSTAQKWKFVPSSDGYYYIVPSNHPTYTLYVSSAYSRCDVTLSTQTESTKKRFRFYRNWDGSYHIVSKAGSGSYGLCSGPTTGAASVYNYVSYVSTDFLDDWTLEKVSRGTADVFCFNYVDYKGFSFNTEQYLGINETESDIIGEALSGGYGRRMTLSGYSVRNYCNSTATIARQKLLSSDVFVYSGHGGNSGLWFYRGEDEFDSTLVVSLSQWDGYINRVALDLEYGDLNGLRFAITQSCSTGNSEIVDGTTYDMLGTFYYNGAHCAIGYAHTSYTGGDVWMQYFWYYVYQGYTVAEAIAAADDAHCQPYYNYSSWYKYGRAYLNRNILGDTAMCLYPEGQF